MTPPFPITALLVLTPLIVIGALIVWVCDPENRKKVIYAIQFLFGVLLLAIFGPPYQVSADATTALV